MPTYKAKENYTLHEIAEEAILFKKSGEYLDHDCAIVFNETGAKMWKALENKACTKESLTDLLCREYQIEQVTAEGDVEKFLQKCMKENMIDVINEG